MSCYVKRLTGKEQMHTFQMLNELLTSPQRNLTLASNASQHGVGAILSQWMDDGSEHPTAYAPRTLFTAGRNYCNLEREALSLVFGVMKFHQYIYGRHFCLVTDRKTLESLFNEKTIPTMAAARIQHWVLTLATSYYSIDYKPGPEHVNADALSRLPLLVSPPTTPLPVETVCVIELPNSTPVSVNEKNGTRFDPKLAQVIKYVQQGWPNHN